MNIIIENYIHVLTSKVSRRLEIRVPRLYMGGALNYEYNYRKLYKVSRRLEIRVPRLLQSKFIIS